MTSKAAREKWNAEHYRQVNISVGKGIADEYRALCARERVSVAGDLKSFMEQRCGIAGRDTGTNAGKPSRDKRRKGTASAILQLECILADEEAYLERMPENLRGGARAEAAEHSMAMLAEAISLLEEAY
jgi:hypothetical protein